jgi:hypothetical protein
MVSARVKQANSLQSARPSYGERAITAGIRTPNLKEQREISRSWERQRWMSC